MTMVMKRRVMVLVGLMVIGWKLRTCLWNEVF